MIGVMLMLTGTISMDVLSQDNEMIQCVLCQMTQPVDHVCPPPNKAFGDELIEPCGEYKWLLCKMMLPHKDLVLRMYFLVIFHRHTQWTSARGVLHLSHQM